MAACEQRQEAKAPPSPRPVRTVTVGPPSAAQADIFPGTIEAKDAVDLGFRIGGRLAERLVDVGSRVKTGQVLARLDAEIEQNELRAAGARLAAAESAERQATEQFGRTSQLTARGIVSQAEFEAAEQAMKGARSQREVAAARLRIAENVVGFTVLKADADGVVTSVGAEPGEVVAAGRPVLRLARRDGRDAVIDVPGPALDAVTPDSLVTVRLPAGASAPVRGRVREISPEADPVTRLFRVRIGLADPPEDMRMGTPVQVSITPAEAIGVSLPPSALVREGSAVAVLVLDVPTQTVRRRPVELGASGPGSIVVARGLSAGDVVVTAGASTLGDGQAVRFAGGPR
nr:efflux RND transporter periplasmic adaptor subunit [Alsobacter ponti]